MTSAYSLHVMRVRRSQAVGIIIRYGPLGSCRIRRAAGYEMFRFPYVLRDGPSAGLDSLEASLSHQPNLHDYCRTWMPLTFLTRWCISL